MKARTLTLLGALALAQSAAPAQPGLPPVPAQGPPAGVAGFGALPPHPDFSALMQPFNVAPMAAPLAAVKFITPKDVRVTAYPGAPFSRVYDASAVVGLRPGYAYRFELTNLPYAPGKSIYPEVEVRGTLVPRPGMKYMNYPLPIVLSQNDIDKVLKGVVLTKVIYLEDPDKALPTQVDRDAPVETEDGTEDEAIKAAIANGRLMAIVRVGNLKLTAEQLRPFAIEGTILLPGEKALRAPAVPPQFRYYACPMYDPLLGPKAAKEECVVDGGDREGTLGIGRNDQLGGLNPTDVGVEYTIGGQPQGDDLQRGVHLLAAVHDPPRRSGFEQAQRRAECRRTHHRRERWGRQGPGCGNGGCWRGALDRYRGLSPAGRVRGQGGAGVLPG